MNFIVKVNFFDIAIGLSQCAEGPEQNHYLKMWGGKKISVEPLFKYNIDFLLKMYKYLILFLCTITRVHCLKQWWVSVDYASK